MKKSYERVNLIIMFSLIFFLIIISFLIFLFNKRIIIYKKVSGVVFNEDVVTFLVNDYDLDLFYKNEIIYVLGKKKKFSIKQIEKNVLTRNNNKYHYVYLEVEFSKNYKVNDILEISIVEKNVRCIDMFRIIWEV